MSDDDLLAALQRHFNFPAFRPGQEAALRNVLNQRDTLVVMPTGSGKSLIYQLAALQLSGVTLVISPLVALMKDQVDSLMRRNIAATFINSSLSAADQSTRLNALAVGQFKIVLVAPERLRNRAFRDALSHIPIGLLTIDEAHCLSQWGHDFRPDYLHIAEARTHFKAPITFALTATATPRVQDDILRLLGLSGAEKIITGFNRPNLTLEVFSTPTVPSKLEFLQDFLAQIEGAGIIYTGTRRDAEEVTDFIREVVKREVAVYHAGLDSETRTRVQDSFMAGDLPIVVATNAFGMGIDRPDVRFVLHYSVPGTLEAYYQEAGRAGRDGLPARVVLLYSPKDTALHEFFIENDSPTIDDLRTAYAFLKRSPITRFDEIERATGLPQVKARVAIEQLEIAHALRRQPNESFGVMRVEVDKLIETELRAVAAQVQARREHKYRQLEVMVDYAETNRCRRRSILDHFGDTGSADAPVCCDNCLARAESIGPADASRRSASSQSERAALIVLDTIAHLKWDIGKGKLAQILKGSQAQDIKQYGYEKSRNFGKFIALKKYEVENLIEQMIASGYLKQVGSDRPTLKLSPRGETALQNRSAIQVELRSIAPNAAQQIRAQKEAGGTIALTEQLLARGLTPDRIAAERGLSVGTIYSHLSQLIARGQVDVNAVVPAELQGKIRAAIAEVGSVQYLAPIKMLLPEEIDYNVIRCVANAWSLEHAAADPSLRGAYPERDVAQQKKSDEAIPSDRVAAFLSRSHPRSLKGPWLAGWALDFHSRYDGDVASRSAIGELVFRYKYNGERQLANELASRWIELLHIHPELPQANAIIPVPPSTQRDFDPVTHLAKSLAEQLNIAALLNVLIKTRTTRPQKEMTALAQKQANVVGAFALKGDVRGQRVLLIDDLFDSGATLSEAARVLTRGGAASIVVLTLTKTIHSDA
jgi:ATP-dependent DNA helicase RecQ